jgi:hypothetical protein
MDDWKQIPAQVLAQEEPSSFSIFNLTITTPERQESFLDMASFYIANQYLWGSWGYQSEVKGAITREGWWEDRNIFPLGSNTLSNHTD